MEVGDCAAEEGGGAEVELVVYCHEEAEAECAQGAGERGGVEVDVDEVEGPEGGGGVEETPGPTGGAGIVFCGAGAAEGGGGGGDEGLELRGVRGAVGGEGAW